VAYTYDALGRVTSEESRGFTHEYTYDLGGNRVATDFGTGRSETRAYDALNRPVGITENARTTSYYYDLAGRAVGQLSGNGQWGTSHYDALGRLVRRTLREGTGGAQPVVAELTFHYDAVGNLRQQEEWWPGEVSRSGVRTTTLGYDSADRLRQELVNEGANQTSTSYSYDRVGNRETKTVHSNGVLQKQFYYPTNGRNQLTSWTEYNGSGVLQRSATLTYDAAGNRITQSITPAGGSSQLTTYAWDYDNRLTSVTLPGSLTHTYGYDYRTRRITRSEPGENPVVMTFSGGLSVAEYEVTDPLLGTLGALPEVEYQRGPDMGGGVGGLLYSLRSGTAKFNLSNGRGDVVAQSDASGTLTWTASYEAYGKRPVETGSNVDRQRGNTKEEDPTGLLNEGFRYRDLETGTWLSRDPAGFVDGPNLYAYVTQNPWTAFDPEGLALRWLVDKFEKHISEPLADLIVDQIPGETCAEASGTSAFKVAKQSAEVVQVVSKGALETLAPGSSTLDAAENYIAGKGEFTDLATAVAEDFGGKKVQMAMAAADTVVAVANDDWKGAAMSAAGVLAGGKGNGKAAPPGQVYDVGLAKDLRKNGVPGTQVNHVPGSAPASTLVGDHNPTNDFGNEASIRLPISEHNAVSKAQQALGAQKSARDLLANEARILKNLTKAPNSAIQKAIRLNKETHPWDYRKILGGN
jgi:RHS repeat-associated protein